jgi:hypothetical protein
MWFMERAYLLLRNNQQSGPFTIDELLQQKLRPSDMIWVEGKSAAWTYLSELELIPFVKNQETPGQEQTVKTPDEIERKAEELRQRLLATPPKTYFPNYITEIESYSSPYKLDDEIQFVDNRKEKRIKKNTALGELMLTCLVIGLFMLGIYKGKSFLGARHKVQTSVATQLNSGDEHAAKKNTPVNQVAALVTDTTKQVDSLLTIQRPKSRAKKTVTDSLNSSMIQTAVSGNTSQQEKKEEASVQLPPPVSHENTAKKEDTPAKKEIAASIPEVKTSNESVREEKKGFLRGLFKKKKKEEDKQE